MKNFFPLFLIIFFLTLEFEFAQDIANFNTKGDLGGFTINSSSFGGGTALDSIYQANDPTSRSAGVMIMHFTFNKKDKGICKSSVINTNFAQVITYYIYVPSSVNIPDSISIGIFAVDNVNSQLYEVDTYAKDIPKDIWYPLSIPIKEFYLSNPKFDIGSGIIQQTGINVSNLQVPNTIWSGNIYIDDITLMGSEPSLFTYFKSGLSGFSTQWTNGWVDSISQTTQPIGDSIGVMKFNLKNGSAKTGGCAIGIQPTPSYKASTYNFLVIWVYVDSTFPDSGYIQVFAQDNSFWDWPSPKGIITYNGKNIPKDIWYPLYFDLSQASIMDKSLGSEFNSENNPLGKFGLQIDAPNNWNGTVYIDKVEFINSTVTFPPKWVAANFENAAFNLQGFVVPAFASGSIARILDKTTGNNSYVMEGDVDFSKTPNKFAVFRNGITLMDASNNYATKASFDVFIPSNIPVGSNIQFVITVAAAINPSSWIQYDNLVGTQLIWGKWNTIWMNIDSLVKTGSIDPTKLADLGVQIISPSNSTWAGKLYFDNLILFGITQPNQLTVINVLYDNLPKYYKLYNNYPNPFNPSTIIRYDLPKQSDVIIKVYDILGKEVADLVNENEKPGFYHVNFNAENFSTGVYFYSIKAGNFVKYEKMMLLK